MTDHSRSHRETWALLPWLANGSATPAQRERAQAHLRGCADCRAELAREQRLAQAMVQPAAPAPDIERGLQSLMRRIDVDDQAGPLPGRWRMLAGARLGLSAVAALGLAELLLVGAGALWWLNGTAPPPADAAPYRTLTTQPDPAAADDVRWRVVFQEQRTLAELQGLLRTHGLSIVAGPSEAGVFTLAAALPQAAEADALAARLRQSPLVRFAEAVPRKGPP
jgi:hypothetical protein